MLRIVEVPWLIAAVALYSVIALFGHFPIDGEVAGAAAADNVFGSGVAHIRMISGAMWTVTVGDLVVVFTLGLLFIELMKATRYGTASVIDHALSLVVFIVCLLEFVLWKRAATSVFFTIIIATFIDVLAGFSISVRAARRDLVMGGGDH